MGAAPALQPLQPLPHPGHKQSDHGGHRHIRRVKQLVVVIFIRLEAHQLRRDRIRYRAPYRNWTYRTLTPGYRLQSGFYGRNYSLTDYGRYRLHRPGYNQQWIRYGDDLLLVNVRTGRVIQVLRNRYW